MKDLKIKRLPHGEGLELPSYVTDGAAAMDIQAAEDVVIQSGSHKLVATGLAFEIPRGYEMQIRARSGLAFKHGIFVVNGPATIDSDYRGEVKVILGNFGKDAFPIKRGDRIAQILLAPVTRANVLEVDELSETNRGLGGFGSTGTR